MMFDHAELFTPYGRMKEQESYEVFIGGRIEVCYPFHHSEFGLHERIRTATSRLADDEVTQICATLS